MVVRKKYVNSFVSKGKLYYYFRKGGFRRALPSDPDSPEFDIKYWELRSGRNEQVVKTTFDTLIADYYNSPKFKGLKPRTRSEYRRTLEYLREKNKNKDFTKLKRRDVIAARDKHSETWRKANAMVDSLSILSKHAIDLEWIVSNPASGVPKLKGNSYAPWPDKLLEDYEKYCSKNNLTIERTVYELCIGTGQRIGDVCKLQWDQFTSNGFMHLVQEKTGTELEVACPQRLIDYLTQLPRSGDEIVGLKKRTVQTRIQGVREKIGAEEFVIHGWRYNAAINLAEAGCSDAEIQAVTGHLTLEMVKKYRGQAERKRLSKAAQTKLEQKRKVTNRVTNATKS